MNTTPLPTKTEQIVEIDGAKALVIVLNELHRTDADKAARRQAQAACRGLLKGGDDYDLMMAEIRQLTPDQQADYIVASEYFKIREEVEKKFVLPELPAQGEDETAEAFTKRYADVEKAIVKLSAKIDAGVTEAMEKKKAAAAAMATAKRVDACREKYFASEFYQAFVRANMVETLLRAVRGPLDGEIDRTARSRRYFASVAEIEDLDDTTREMLWETYEALSVDPRQIPTSPGS